MIPEAPFLFAIAGLSASLAGLAGLVAALRRGSDLRPMDAFRLREIVEFAFANIVFAVGMVPFAQIVGSVADASRIAGGLVLAYAVGSTIVLFRRTRSESLSLTRGWASIAAVLNVTIIAAAVWVIWSGTMVSYEVALVTLLARPMLAFLLVLASFEAPSSPRAG